MSGSESRANVPKFASFKLPTEPKLQEEHRKSSSSVRISKRSHHERRSTRQHHHHHDHHSPRSRSRSPRSNKPRYDIQISPKEDLRAKQSGLDDWAYKDVRGDKQNLVYRENEKSKVPAYYSCANRMLLGGQLIRGTEHSREPASPLSSLGIRAASILSTTDAPFVGPLKQQPSVVLGQNVHAHDSGLATDNDNHDFIALDRFRRSQSEGMLANDGDDDDGIERDDANESNENDAFGRVKSEHARLGQLLKARPADPQVWLDYAEYQETWLATSVQVSSLESQIARAKYTVYRDALKSVSSGQGAIALLMMQEAQKFYDQDKLVESWRRVVESYRDDLDLRRVYLRFLRSNLGIFDYKKWRTELLDYLHILRYSPPSTLRTQHYLLALLLTSWHWDDMGYHEMAIALWQCLIGYTFRAAPTSEASSEQRWRIIRQLWEKEGQRVGDAAPDDRIPSVSIQSAHPHLQAEPEDAETTWFTKELREIHDSALPCRSVEATREYDTFQVVLFTDLEPFLNHFPDVDDIALLQAFLCSQNLPALSIDQTKDSQWSLKWWEDCNNRHAFSKPSNAFSLHSIGTSDTFRAVNILKTMQNFAATTDTLFNDGIATADSFSSGNIFRRGFNPQLHTFISNVLGLFEARQPDCNALSIYHLAWELQSPSTISFKDVRSLGKRLLKEGVGQALLWNAYIRAAACTDQAEAKKLLKTVDWDALPFDTLQKGFLIFNSVTRAWFALLSEDAADQREVVQEMSKDLGVDTSANQDVELWNIRRASTTADAALHLAKTELHALYRLMASEDMSEVVESFQRSRILLQHAPNNQSLERLYQTQANIIDVITNRETRFNTRRLLDSIIDGILAYPNNTILQDIYHKLERKLDLVNHIRKAADSGNPSTTSKSAIRFASDIAHEIVNSENTIRTGATTYSVREMFETAVNSEAGMHCPTIWTAWVVYEYEVACKRRSANPNSAELGDKLPSREEGSQAKAVYYRGLAKLPWVKSFAMLAFSYLRNALTKEELRGIYEHMENAGMRIIVEMNMDD